MTGTIEIQVGGQLWFEGELVEIRELHADVIVLRTGSEIRALPIREVLASATPLGSSERTPSVPPNVLLSQATDEERQKVETQVLAVAKVLEHCERTGASINKACADLAEQFGVSKRQLNRWVVAHEEAGQAGLIDPRKQRATSQVDHRWDDTCLAVLRQYVPYSTPTVNVVVARTNATVMEDYGDQVSLPSRATAYRRVKELSKGKHAFGSAKARRSVAARPQGALGRLRAQRPGEYVVLDTTPLDVYAMEAGSGRWLPVELTVAQDLYTRCIVGLRLTPVSTRSIDVANVLYQCVAIETDIDSEQAWPFHGVPTAVLLEPSIAKAATSPRLLPEEIIIDRGRAFLSAHIVAACARLGINVQPAIPHKPTDKPTVERFFRTLRQSLLQHLPGYMGPDIYSRGANVEDQSFYFIEELEQIIRSWVGTIYHHTAHAGLVLPELPGVDLSPLDAYAMGLAKTHALHVPDDPNLPFAFLEVEWRMTHTYGVEVHGRRYDSDALTAYRSKPSPYTGRHRGKWPIFIDRHDVRRVWFLDIETQTYEPLVWDHAAALSQPFSYDAAEYLKRRSLEDDRFVDPEEAVQALLQEWATDERLTRKDRFLARKLNARRHRTGDDPVPTTTKTKAPVAPADSAPSDAEQIDGIVDLTQRRADRQALAQQADIDEMWAAYLDVNDEMGVES